MSNLSVKKLNEYKKVKCFTNKTISKLTGIPIATVDRLFSGANSNPNVCLLQKIAKLFECTVDDFIDYDKDSPLAKYYESKEAAKLAQEICKNSQYKKLMDTVKSLSFEQLDAVINVANIIKKSTNI